MSGKRMIKIGIALAILLFSVGYVSLCSFFQAVPFSYGILYILFNIVCVFSVGNAIIHVFNFEMDNCVERAAFSYAVGYACNLILYMLLFPVAGRRVLILAVWGTGLVCFVISCIYAKKKLFFEGLTKTEWIVLGVVIAAVLGLQFFLFAANNSSVLRTGQNSYYVDLMYWASDATTLTKCYPPINFRDYYLPGVYHYHYFSSMQIAVMSMCTKIPVYNVVLGYSFIANGIFMTLTVFAFLKRIVKKPAFIAIGLLLFFFTTGYEEHTYVTIVSHLFIAPFGNDIGIALSLLIYMTFADRIAGRKKGIKYDILVFIGFAVCVGVKGPVGMMLMVMCGLLCIYNLIAKKENRGRAFCYGVCFFVIFVLMYLFVINGFPGASSRTQFFLEEGQNNSILNLPLMKKTYIDLNGRFGIIVGNILFCLGFAVRTNPAVFISLLVLLFLRILQPARFKEEIDMPVFGIFIGIIITRFMKMIGFSQVYFTMAVIPYAIAYSVYYFERIEGFLCEKGKIRLANGLVLTNVVLILVGMGLVVNTKFCQPQLVSGIKKALNISGIRDDENAYVLYQNGEVKVTSIEKKSDYTDSRGFLVITEDMYNACRWIEANTEEDALIASNVMLPSEYQYPLGVFSNRWIWTRDTAWLTTGLKGRRCVLYRLVADGVDYIITSKVYDSLEEEPLVNVETVYENDTTKVIRITENRAE